MSEMMMHNLKDMKLKRYLWLILTAILLIIVLIPLWFHSTETVFVIQQGVLDLRSQDLFSSEVFTLQGDWTFYPQEILKPGEKPTVHANKLYQALPAYGHPIDDVANAYGTYQLEIKLPDTIPQSLMLWLPFEGGVYRFYVNDMLRAVNNQPDPYHNAQELRQLPIIIQDSQDTLTFQFNISWLSNRHAGLSGPVLLGSKGAIYRYLALNSQKAFLSVGLLGIILCVLLLLGYILEHKAIVLLAIFSMLINIQAGLYQLQTATLSIRLNHMNNLRIIILLSGFIVFSYAKYANQHYKGFFSINSLKILRAIAILFAFFAFFTPARYITIVYFGALLYGIFFPLGLCGYQLWLGLKVTTSFDHMMLGMSIIYAVTQVDQSLKQLLALHTMYFGPIGIFCVALFHVVYLTFMMRQKLQHTNELLEENRSMYLQLKEHNSLLEETVENRTEALKEANKNLTEAENLRKELISTISHELNTPLTLIRGYAEAMHDGLISFEQSKVYIKLIYSKALDMTALLEDLIKLNRLDPEGIVLKQERCSLALLMADMSNKFSQDIRNNGLSFVLDPAAHWNLFEVYIDYRRINQVFANIIFNAIKFTPNGGTISMGCQVKADMVVISIRDTGPGIPSAEYTFIFDRYYQGTIDPVREASGQGLGLNIAREIINLHGGEIWVESVLGEGSVFYFTLPIYHEKISKDKMV